MDRTRSFAPLLLAVVSATTLWHHVVHTLRHRLADDVGEGVISTAIAVLIMAFIGAAAYVAFQGIFDGAATKTNGIVEGIGS